MQTSDHIPTPQHRDDLAAKKLTRFRLAFAVGTNLLLTFGILLWLAFFLGERVSVEDLLSLALDPVLFALITISFLGTTSLQLLLVLPVLPVAPRDDGSPSRWRSVAVGGAAGFWGFLLIGFLDSAFNINYIRNLAPIFSPAGHSLLLIGTVAAFAVPAAIAYRLRETRRADKDVSLRLTVLAAAFIAATLVLAAVLAVFSLLDYVFIDGIIAYNREEYLGVVLALVFAIAWAWWGWLIWRFRTGTAPDTYISKLAARLFIGSVIEIVAIIPLDAMVRRKTSCYCGEGTFFALVLCWSAGLLALGPIVIFLPLGRRFRRLANGLCRVCGYDMRGNPTAACCPECGVGWRTPSTPPAPANISNITP